MQWVIRLSQNASQDVGALEPFLRDELIEQLAAMAESPGEFLRRSSATGQFPGLYVYSYRSQVVPDMVVSAYFDGFDHYPRHLDLVAIVQETASQPED